MFLLNILMKWTKWFWYEESKSVVLTWIPEEFFFLCQEDDAEVFMKKGRKVEQWLKYKLLGLKRLEIDPYWLA